MQSWFRGSLSIRTGIGLVVAGLVLGMAGVALMLLAVDCVLYPCVPAPGLLFAAATLVLFGGGSMAFAGLIAIGDALKLPWTRMAYWFLAFLALLISIAVFLYVNVASV